jgi:hypothetical protein
MPRIGSHRGNVVEMWRMWWKCGECGGNVTEIGRILVEMWKFLEIMWKNLGILVENFGKCGGNSENVVEIHNF